MLLRPLVDVMVRAGLSVEVNLASLSFSGAIWS